MKRFERDNEQGTFQCIFYLPGGQGDSVLTADADNREIGAERFKAKGTNKAIVRRGGFLLMESVKDPCAAEILQR